MIAIFQKECKAYFHNPMGYVFLSIYYLFSGYFFFRYNLYGNSTDMRTLFEMLFTVTLFLVPILTMRLMSEERRNKTEQLLLMTPVSTWQILLGKFLAATMIYLLAMSILILQAALLSSISQVAWQVVMGHFIGLFLLGTTLIAVGLFISTLTENQIIAAIGGFSVGFFLMLLDSVASLITYGPLAKFVSSLSFQTHYQNFALGLFDWADVAFYISVTMLFIFFARCVFERRKAV